MAAPAVAEIEGPCTASFNGYHFDDLDTPAEAKERLVIQPGETVTFYAAVPDTDIVYVDILFPPLSIPLVEFEADEPSDQGPDINEVEGELDLGAFAEYGAGIFQFVGRTDDCRGNAYFIIGGVDPWETAVGKTAIGIAGVGVLIGLTSWIPAAVAGGGGIVRSVIAGGPIGLGAAVLVQQAGMIPLSATSVGVAVAGSSVAAVLVSKGLAAGHGAVTGAASAGGALPPPPSVSPPPASSPALPQPPDKIFVDDATLLGGQPTPVPDATLTPQPPGTPTPDAVSTGVPAGSPPTAPPPPAPTPPAGQPTPTAPAPGAAGPPGTPPAASGTPPTSPGVQPGTSAPPAPGTPTTAPTSPASTPTPPASQPTPTAPAPGTAGPPGTPPAASGTPPTSPGVQPGTSAPPAPGTPTTAPTPPAPTTPAGTPTPSSPPGAAAPTPGTGATDAGTGPNMGLAASAAAGAGVLGVTASAAAAQKRAMAGEGASEPHWFYVTAPTDVYDIDDYSTVIGQLQPGNWYAARAAYDEWVHAIDQKTGAEGWVARHAVKRQQP